MLLEDPAPATRSAPLVGSYRRLRAASPLARFDIGAPRAGDGWVTGRQLAEDQAVVERLVRAETERIHGAYGTAPRTDVAATWVLHRYAFTVCLAMAAPWFLERRVPRLPLDGVGYGWRDRALSVRPSAVTALRGDPAAEHSGARTVTGAAALRAELRTAVAAHLGPVLDGFRPFLRRGKHALWGLACDELTDSLRHLGRVLGTPQSAADAAGALLPGGTPPFVGGAHFEPPTEPDGEPARTRVGCCLYYTLRPAELCAGCPRSC